MVTAERWLDDRHAVDSQRALGKGHCRRCRRASLLEAINAICQYTELCISSILEY